ncbi:hypothetical protein QBC33DRAFT_520048 [Phialemonium atrogriseum]|uniref:Uncharacterized protein n=1 Tax=Phialemonium atrogriseum TaxID=1093897 RepID=A0AAJ0BPM4_9PEZI|nr:uncharacterized protein QBC33DRAFT_520048 [Phialemonium atrogriseum]KAK1761875.1 hypothetical protein QBC33DRAFT_520048 [Phialemonium atrogriseum]
MPRLSRIRRLSESLGLWLWKSPALGQYRSPTSFLDGMGYFVEDYELQLSGSTVSTVIIDSIGSTVNTVSIDSTVGIDSTGSTQAPAAQRPGANKPKTLNAARTLASRDGSAGLPADPKGLIGAAAREGSGVNSPNVRDRTNLFVASPGSGTGRNGAGGSSAPGPPPSAKPKGPRQQAEPAVRDPIVPLSAESGGMSVGHTEIRTAPGEGLAEPQSPGSRCLVTRYTRLRASSRCLTKLRSLN